MSTDIPAWVEAFLAERRYAAVASKRADGTAFAVPLGFLWRSNAVLLSIRDGRSGVARFRRNSAIAFSVNDQRDPPTWVAITGNVREVPDPGNEISLELMRRYKSVVPGIDLGRFSETWLNTGRVVFRLDADDISYGRSAWAATSATVAME